LKSYRQLAAEYGVHFQTVRRWVKAAGITPNYLEPSTSGKKGGLLTVLDDEQIEQLEKYAMRRYIDYLKKKQEKSKDGSVLL